MSQNDDMTIRIDYFSDILCIWAYVAQIRVDELLSQFDERVEIDYHFFPVFGCTESRIGEGWKDRGGFAGYNEHVRGIADRFEHVDVNPGVWLENVPLSSAPCHHFLAAVTLLERDGVIPAEAREALAGRTPFEAAAWRLRCAFFQELLDVGRLQVQMDIAEDLGLPVDEVRKRMNSGAAMALMCRDFELKDRYGVEGSPTYILNSGRQKLYGDVGYKIIDANIREILNRREDQLSWC
jgi:predicted DsbA family dithiol-disulfide isomerase